MTFPRPGALALALVLTGTAQGWAQAPEPVIVELGLGRIASRTTPAYRVGDAALVPFRAFLELAELRAIVRPGGVVETMVQPGNIPLVVDPGTHTLTLGKNRQVLGEQDMVTANDEVYLSTDVLGRALGLEWGVSWPDLQVVVLEPGSLPIGRRIRREATLRSRLADADQPSAEPSVDLGLERPRVDGVVLDYSVLAPSGAPLDGATYSTALGLDLVGGSFALGLQSQGAGTGPRTDASWTGIWRDNRYLTQLRLGDAFATGPRPRSLRGFSISNSPYARPAWLGAVPFSGNLGPGWSVEAWRGGRLIGFDSVNALGQFSFDVPVQYGENALDFVAYGPFGEVREFNQSYRVSTDGIPAHHFEYAVSVGACRELCQATGNVDLRYGLDNRWTLRAGVDRFWRDTLADLTHPSVGVTGAVANAWTVEGEAVGQGVLRGALHFQPTMDLQLGLEGDRFARGVTAPILTPDGRLDQWTFTAFVRPLPRWAANYVELGLDRIRMTTGQTTSGRVAISFQAADVRLIPAVRFEHSASPGAPTQDQRFYGLNAFVLPRPGLGSLLGSVSFRGAFELEDGVGASSASAFAGLPITNGLRAELGTSWTRGARGPGLSLLIAAELPSVRTYTSLNAGGGLPATGSQYVQGSAIYNPARRGVDLTHGPSLERGGVTGRAFLDLNGDGRFDDSDEPLPGIRVVVGQVWSLTDSGGRYRVWDVLPFEPTRVEVDTTTLGSPLWVPAFTVASVEPSPNTYRELDIPVAPGGVIEGRVTRETAGGTLPAPGGVVLHARHATTGEVRSFITFSDGTFYAMGFRPGAWELRVDSKCLTVLGATAQPLRFSITAKRDGTTVSGLEVELGAE
jgi:hypothetical protein